MSYDELLNCVEMLKYTLKELRIGLKHIMKDNLFKTNKSLVYRKHKTEFKVQSYLIQVTNSSHRRGLTKL